MSDTATEDKNLLEVQERLMKMLDSVRLDPNAPPVDRPETRQKQTSPSNPSGLDGDSEKLRTCPNCRAQKNWNGNPWCPACGYHPKLKRKVVSSEELEAEESDSEPEDLTLLTMLTLVPTWVYWLSGGILFLLCESLAVRLLLPRLSQRSPIAIVQIFLGFNVLGIAHLRAYYIAAKENEDLNFISVLWSPFVIWQTALTQMPDVRRTLYAGSWGLCAILFAICLIGVDYLSLIDPDTYQPKKALNPMRMIMSVAKNISKVGPPPKAKINDGSLEEALEDFAGSETFDFILEENDPANMNDPLEEAAQDADSKVSDEKKSPDKKKAAPPRIVWSSVDVKTPREFDHEYIVIGYLTNASGELRSLLLAETLPDSGVVRYAGKYTIGINDKDFIKKLQLKLENYRSRYPAMKTPYIAKWTAPFVSTKIVHNGILPDGRFEEGQIIYFKETPPQPNDRDRD